MSQPPSNIHTGTAIIEEIHEEYFSGNFTRAAKLRRHQRTSNRVNGYSDTDSENENSDESSDDSPDAPKKEGHGKQMRMM